MWSTIRFGATRQLRVLRAISGNGAAGLASRITPKQSPFTIPSSYRVQFTPRGYAGTRGRPRKDPATKKAASAKPVKRGRKPAAKKVLSEEDKTKLEIRKLKEVALLKEPAKLPSRAWVVYVVQQTKGTHTERGHLGERTRQLGQEFKALSASEIERLQVTASQNKLANEAAYKSWVESHTPEEIAEANRARNRLRRTFKVATKAPIKDDRQPKRSVNAYLLFVKSRWQSGDFTGQPAPQVTKAISQEWKALSDAERRPFEDTAQVDMARYVKEKSSVLNEEVQHAKKA